jgi:diacylglycerol kinase
MSQNELKPIHVEYKLHSQIPGLYLICKICMSIRTETINTSIEVVIDQDGKGT